MAFFSLFQDFRVNRKALQTVWAKSGHPGRVKADSFWNKRGLGSKRTSVVFQLCNILCLTLPNSSRRCSSLKGFWGLRNALHADKISERSHGITAPTVENTLLISPPATICSPSGQKAQAYSAPAALSVAQQVPVLASQGLSVWSSEAETIQSPAELMAHPFTPALASSLVRYI